MAIDPTGPTLVVSAWAPELLRLGQLSRKTPGAKVPMTSRAVGVGLVESAMGATRALADMRVAAVVFVGTAGRYPAARTAPKVGQAAVVRRILLASSAVVHGAAYFPESLPAEAAADEPLRTSLAAAGPLPIVEVACPLAITTSVEDAKLIFEETGCALENLEVFAVARAAANAGVPFAAILGIANDVGPNAHAQWKTHAAKASAAACEVVWAWLNAKPSAKRAK